MTIRHYIRLSILLFAVTSVTYSQADKNGGSIYSIFGLGDLSYSSSNRTDGMGIMGIGLYGDYTNINNPAAWARIPTTIFTSKFNFESIKSTDGTSSAKRTYGNFEGFDLSIPLNKGNGWVMDFGINNYSQVNYDTKFSGSSLGENFTQTYSGNGGLNRLSAGLSYIIFKQFSIGAQFNYAFGNINKSLTIDFTNNSLTDTKNASSNTIHGVYFNIGLMFHGFGKVFNSKKLDNLTLGAFVTTPSNFNSNITGKFRRSVENTDSISLTSGKLEMPLAFGIGISNMFNNRLIVAADFYMQQWDNLKYYDYHPPEIKNNMKVGLGFEYTHSRKLEDPYLSRVSFRLGANYVADYIRVNNENINAFGINAGVSLPIGRYNSVDLYIRYHVRGKATNGLIKDEIFRAGASVKIGELWFLQPSDDF